MSSRYISDCSFALISLALRVFGEELPFHSGLVVTAGSELRAPKKYFLPIHGT